MHILHFYKNALPESIGGVEQTIDQIARGTSKLGVSNTVLSLSDNPHPSTYRFHGYDLVTTKRDFEIKSTSFSWQSLDIFKKLSQRADLIHFHFPCLLQIF